MDRDLRSLLITFSLDLLIFVCCAALFFRLRHLRGDDKRCVGESAAAYENVHQRGTVEKLGALTDGHASFAAPNTSKVAGACFMQSSDVRLYLTFLRLLAGLFATLAFLGIVVVLPLNLSGHGGGLSRSDALALASAANLSSSEWRMWVLYMMTWVYSAIAYAYIWTFHNAVHTDRLAAPTFEQQLASFTVMIRGLDPRVVDAVVVREPFVKFHGEHLIACSVVREYLNLNRASRAFGAAEQRVERCNFDGCIPPPPDTAAAAAAALGSSGRTLGIHDDERAAEEEIEYRAKVLRREQRLPALRNVGVCFLIFDSTERARETLTDHKFSRVSNEFGWTLLPAPPPSDINWDNLHIRPITQFWRATLTSSALFVLCVLVVSPVSVLDELHPLMEGVGKVPGHSTWARMMIAGYLPPLIILMINSMAIPFLISHITHFDRFWMRSSKQAASMHMNIAFMVINSLIIPLLSVNSLGLLVQDMVATPVDHWNAALGASFLSSSGSFAIRYLINSSLLSSGVQLLQLPHTLYHKFQMTVTSFTDETLHKMPSWNFDFGYWYAAALSICFLCLTLSVAVPLLLPCAATFFVIKYFVDSYNFQYGIYNVDLESRGALAEVATIYLLSAVSFMQFCMSGLFVVHGGTTLAAASTLLFGASMLTWGLLACHQGFALLAPQQLISRRSSACSGGPVLRYADKEQLLALRHAYVHPLDRHNNLKESVHVQWHSPSFQNHCVGYGAI